MTLAALAAMVLIDAAGVRAQAPARIDRSMPCYNDARKWCPSDLDDPEAAKRCLEKRLSKLSAGCLNVLELDRGQPCLSDAKKHCQAVMGRPARVMSCLRKNRSKVAPDCRKSLEAQAKPCANDVAELCSGAPPDQILRCLIETDATISPGCEAGIRKGRDALMKVCGGAIRRFCSNAGPYQEVACLSPRLADPAVSSACRERITAIRQGRLSLW